MKFAGKAAASAEKVRGGYYSPAPVARFLAGWVCAAGPKTVEPSCGDGAILRELATRSDPVQGIELIADEAAKSRRFAPVDTQSLFAWLATAEAGGWDGVAGNPPCIRFGNWPSQQRDPALAMMWCVGLRPTRLTNAWVPFVVASTILVRDGGRVGLVLPAELLQVTYAAQLRDFLLTRFREITLLTFEPREAEQLPIPPPGCADPDLVRDVDLLLKASETDKALEVVDRRVLIEGLALPRAAVADCRAAWASLRDRRKRRGWR
jgi:adenine-specific DNA methylase